MLVTLLLMISGKAPLYLTAFVGSIVAALLTFPMTGAAVPGPITGTAFTVNSLLISAMHPVILDMLGVLVFIGVMEKAGFLNIIILKVMQFG